MCTRQYCLTDQLICFQSLRHVCELLYTSRWRAVVCRPLLYQCEQWQKCAVVMRREARAARHWPNVRDIFGPDQNGPVVGSPPQGIGSPPRGR